MADDKQIFDVLIPEEYETKNGEVKTSFHRVGVGFSNKSGGINVKVTPGLALSGEFTILPRRDKAEKQPAGERMTDDEIPY